ncbi:MAG: TonB family protein [Bacteroidaceae bacterium]|nr:TonB family protein [Bacteroidaceae bacterium]
MIYLIVSAVSLALMVAVYRLTLSRTTFHCFNRYVLLATLALAAVIPVMHFQSISSRASAPINYMLSEIMVYADGTMGVNPVQATESGSSISIASVFTVVYLAGLIFCLLRIAIGILSSEIICHRRSRMLADGTRLVITERNYAPFSWRNCIVISRKDYELNGAMIIAHEQAHVHHHHSFDLILAQLFCAVQWFNPAAWMLRRSLLEVHEYEADASVLEEGFDGRRYQICLVRAALQGSFATTTNNFSNCSTKKRIVMMNRHSTNPWARLRVLLMLPVVALSVIVASACKQDTNSEMNLKTQDASPSSVFVDIQECEECETEEPDSTGEVFMVIEQQPEFPGGEEAMFEYLRSNLVYPEKCKENKIQGRVLVAFVINKDGKIVEPEVVKSAGPEGVELDVEALRVVSEMPAWTPGKQKGKAVRVRYTIPVVFKL